MVREMVRDICGLSCAASAGLTVYCVMKGDVVWVAISGVAAVLNFRVAAYFSKNK